MSDLIHQVNVDRLAPLDRAIIARLQIDGRTPFSTMAAQLGVSEGTVQRRTQQLIDEGYFKIIGVLDPLRTAQGQAVLIGLGTEPAAIHAIAARVAAIPEARFVSLVTGTFDLICEFVTFDRMTLLNLITETLASIPGIHSINTSWVLANYKTNYLWDRGTPWVPVEAIDLPANDAFPPPQPDALPRSELRLDELDEGIIRVLQEQGRTSYAKLASQLGTTESTARRRTLRLLDSGYLRVVAVGNPFRLGFQDVVMLWIKVDQSRAQEVLLRLAQEPAVRYLSRVAGAADVVAETLFADRTALLRFLDGPLAALEGVREVHVSFELVIHKRAYMRFDEEMTGTPSLVMRR